MPKFDVGRLIRFKPNAEDLDRLTRMKTHFEAERGERLSLSEVLYRTIVLAGRLMRAEDARNLSARAARIPEELEDVRTAPATEEVCPYFVVRTQEGLCWDGSGWVKPLADALHFRGAGDPWSDAKAVADAIARDGVECRVCYVPRDRQALATG